MRHPHTIEAWRFSNSVILSFGLVHVLPWYVTTTCFTMVTKFDSLRSFPPWRPFPSTWSTGHVRPKKYPGLVLRSIITSTILLIALMRRQSELTDCCAWTWRPRLRPASSVNSLSTGRLLLLSIVVGFSPNRRCWTTTTYDAPIKTSTSPLMTATAHPHWSSYADVAGYGRQSALGTLRCLEPLGKLPSWTVPEPTSTNTDRTEEDFDSLSWQEGIRLPGNEILRKSYCQLDKL